MPPLDGHKQISCFEPVKMSNSARIVRFSQSNLRKAYPLRRVRQRTDSEVAMLYSSRSSS